MRARPLEPKVRSEAAAEEFFKGAAPGTGTVAGPESAGPESAGPESAGAAPPAPARPADPAPSAKPQVAGAAKPQAAGAAKPQAEGTGPDALPWEQALANLPNDPLQTTLVRLPLSVMLKLKWLHERRAIRSLAEYVRDAVEREIDQDVAAELESPRKRR